jgi:hypothetical protein
MSDKPVDKTAFVLHRMYPASGLFSDAKKVSEDWLEFLKKMNGFKSVDVICIQEDQVAWLEEWENRISVDKFNEEHLAYADFFGPHAGLLQKIPYPFHVSKNSLIEYGRCWF